MIVELLVRHADFILHFATPVIWCILFVLIMDRETLFATWYMPILGLVAAFLANSVPIGGGIIYIPALALLGANITLGATFSISVMPIGNGLFGFLRWMIKDPTMIIWESFHFTILPSWIGSFVAIFLFLKPNHNTIRAGFGWFCFFLGGLVVAAIYRQGLRNVFFITKEEMPRTSQFRTDIYGELERPSIPTFDDLIVEEVAIADTVSLLPAVETAGGSEPAPVVEKSFTETIKRWGILIFVSFLGGIILVPNIGIGPALITYVALALMGYPDQQALVTGIITGGWVCIAPFLYHIVVLQDVPWQLWIMVLPGVFYGAKFAPFLIDVIGSESVMIVFAIFLFASALLYCFF